MVILTPHVCINVLRSESGLNMKCDALSGCVSVALWGNMGPGTDQLQALSPVSNSTKPLMDRYGFKRTAFRCFI